MSVTKSDGTNFEPGSIHPEIPSEQLQSLLAAIVESSDDAIISKDLNGRVTSWNSAAARMYGYSPQEMVGQSILKIVPERLHEEEQDILRRLGQGERIDHFETTRVHKSGRELCVSLTISPVRNNKGQIVGASKIARDVGQIGEMQQQLIQSEKIAATGRMAATIAHEINNPLEAVVNLIYLARVNPSVNDLVREYLRTAEREIERVSLIARQTLGFFRDTQGPAEVGIADLVDEVLAVYGSKLSYNHIFVERHYSPARPIVGRRGELTQVLANLVSNAIDAMPNGGGLVVSVTEDRLLGDVGLRLQLQDQGTGIPEDQLGQVFDAFFTTKKERGTGIGLWLSRQFIEAHGGTIHVTSSTSGHDRGTCFSIFLPYLPGVQQGTGPAPEAERRVS